MIDDEEKNLYEILAKLQNNNVFNDYEKVTESILIYIEKEWGYEELPTLKDIVMIVDTFTTNAEIMKRVKDIIGNEDYNFLLSFIAAGIDVFLHKEV